MTVTSRLSLIHNCETTDNWSGDPTIGATSEVARVGTYAVGFDVDNETEADVNLDINTIFTGDQDMSNWVIYLWFLYLGAPQNLGATYGLRVGLNDGATTGWYYVNSATTYPGGWVRYAIDCSEAFDSGSTTKTTISNLYLSGTATSKSKLSENFMFDQIEYFDKGGAYSAPIEVTGGGVGTELDFADLVTDQGIVEFRGGAYYIHGPIQFGDTGGTNNCYFQDTGQTVFFADDIVSDDYFEFLLLGHASTTTNFELGEKSGTAGISGCTVRALDPTDAEFGVTATNTDVDIIGLYGSIFDGHGTMDFQPDAANKEILNCTFANGSGQIQPNTMDVLNCNFISNIFTTGAVLMESATHNITYSNFINNTNGVEISVAASVTFSNLQFTGNTYDVYNSSGTARTVSQTDSNANSYDPAGDIVSFETTVNIDIHVQDTDGADIVGAQVYMQKSSPTTYNSHATNNVAGDFTFEASATVDSDTAASGWLIVRAVDEKEWHWYRYASRTTTVFTLPTEITGTADNSGSETTTLYDVAVDFSAGDIVEGDILINETDSSWCQIKSITDSDNIIHSPLVDGSNNYWTTSDAYSIHSLTQTYDGSDTFTVPLVNVNTDGTGDISFSYVHPGGTVVATIKARHSPDAGTKYIPGSASASFTGAYSTTIALFEDTTAT